MPENTRSSELEEILFCDSSCGVNASDALGYDVPCTCGNERLRQEVEALIASKVEEALENHKNIMKSADTYTFEDGTQFVKVKALQSKEGDS